MELKIAVFLSLLLTVSCSNPEIHPKGKAQNSDTPAAEDSLKQKAFVLTKLYNERSCKEFLNEFPDNFEDFILLYGYDDEKGPGPLYSKLEHITYFFECPEVSALEKLKRSIKVGIGGKWDADLTGMFQDGSFDLVRKHPTEAKGILDNLSDERAASFWYFLFDSPHPNDKQNVTNFKLIQMALGKDSKQARLLADQFQELRDSDDGHGY